MSEKDKNHDQEQEPSSTDSNADKNKQRGFYVALFSCVGIMLAIAAVVGYSNYKSDSGTGNQVASVSSSQDESYSSYNLPEVGDDVAGAVDESDESSSVGANDDQTLEQTIEDELAKRSKESESATATPEATDSSTKKSDEKEQDSEKESDEQDAAKSSASAEPTPAATEQDKKSSEAESASEYALFTEGDTMAWPLVGEIVMDFSVDHLIYDPTLAQYRTNDSISIGAVQGSEVTAAADGKVKSVTTTTQNGKTIVIDHGNGWETTYSQLADNVVVQVGDVVTRGETIAYVGEPTIYSVLLGDHLNFNITWNETSIDPNTLLASN